MVKHVLISAVLGLWLSASGLGSEPPGPIVISDLLNLSALCDAPTNSHGVHGGTQCRIVRTSHGTYVAYVGDDDQKQAVVHLIRIREGRPVLLASPLTSVAGSDSVHVVCDADEEVYVVAPGVKSVAGEERAVLSARHIDRTTGAATEHPATVPLKHGSSFGYSSVFVDGPGRSLFALYSGGDAPGYFAWFRFDLIEKRWATEAIVADLAYRHCYNYGFAIGNGGAAILSERDIRNETAGVTPTDTGRKIDANYVWDELRLFHIPDLARPEYTAVDVEAAVYDKPAGLYPNVQNNFQGDAYIDAGGRTHVLYSSDDNNRVKGRFNRHAVLDERFQPVFNEPTPFQESSAMRMFQSTSGRHYIVTMPYGQPARVQVWGATGPEGLKYEMLAEKRLSEDVTPTYAGMVVTCPRSGSIQDDRVDCLFPSERSYYAFSISVK